MSDIVERLRSVPSSPSYELRCDAADEIERLRALVDDLVAAHGDATTAARAAAKNERLEQALEKAERPFDGSETREVVSDE